MAFCANFLTLLYLYSNYLYRLKIYGANLWFLTNSNESNVGINIVCKCPLGTEPSTCLENVYIYIKHIELSYGFRALTLNHEYSLEWPWELKNKMPLTRSFSRCYKLIDLSEALHIAVIWKVPWVIVMYLQIERQCSTEEYIL